MKFLIDENVTKSILQFLRRHEYEVITLKELKKLGIENGEVVKIALDQQAIIITFDSDYLNLKKSLQRELRIIYIHMHRIHPLTAQSLLEKNLGFCLEHLENPGKVIITEHECVFKNPSET